MPRLNDMLFLTLAILAGCGKPPVEFREVKRVHDKVTEAELKRFLRVVDSLADQKLPGFPPIYRPLPDWAPERTLPVSELAKEEQELLDEAWDVEALTRQLKGNRRLERAVRREKLTLEQFAGLTLAIGAARSRSLLRKNQNLDAVIKRGKSMAAQLGTDGRKFANLGREARYTVLRRAGWITRADRAALLKEVPPENVALVKAHTGQLDNVLPEYFRTNPFDGIADMLEEKGMPFEELPASGRDDEITWGPGDNPLVGAPDEGSRRNPLAVPIAR